MSILTALQQSAHDTIEAPPEAWRTARTIVRIHIDEHQGLSAYVEEDSRVEVAIDGLAGFTIATALDEPTPQEGLNGEPLAGDFPRFQRYLGLWIPLAGNAEIDLSGIGK